MDIKASLEQEHSQKMATAIADYIGDDPKRLRKLMDIFFGEDKKLAQRSAYSVMYVMDHDAEMLRPYLEKMVKHLDKPVHDALIRNTLRLFDIIELPDKLMGRIADKCFGYLDSIQQPVAIRVLAMGTLHNISRKYPELKPELALVIREHLPHATFGFKSRAKKVLKDIELR